MHGTAKAGDINGQIKLISEHTHPPKMDANGMPYTPEIRTVLLDAKIDPECHVEQDQYVRSMDPEPIAAPMSPNSRRIAAFETRIDMYDASDEGPQKSKRPKLNDSLSRVNDVAKT